MKPGLVALLTGECGGCGLTYAGKEGEVPNEAIATHRITYCVGEAYCDLAKRDWGDAWVGPHLHVECRLCGKVRAEKTVK